MRGDLQRRLGLNLRACRRARGISQEDFADLFGHHRTYMGALERGERNSLQSVEKLAARQRVPVRPSAHGHLTDYGLMTTKTSFRVTKGIVASAPKGPFHSAALVYCMEKRQHGPMPEHTTIAADYARAVTHPLRFRLVSAMADGPRTLDSLSSELDASAATILRHASALESVDVLRGIDREDGIREYELLLDPIIWDTEWGRLPVETKRSLAAAAVTQVAAIATAAVDRGGFDRKDMHLTRTAIRVDEARWRELASLLGGALHTLGDLAEAPEPDGSTEPTFQATVVMMLFTGEHADSAPAPAARWDETQALTRTWDLGEELEDVAARSATDWDRIEAIAGELAWIARAMKTHPGSEVEPPPRT